MDTVTAAAAADGGAVPCWSSSRTRPTATSWPRLPGCGSCSPDLRPELAIGDGLAAVERGHRDGSAASRCRPAAPSSGGPVAVLPADLPSLTPTNWTRALAAAAVAPAGGGRRPAGHRHHAARGRASPPACARSTAPARSRRHVAAGAVPLELPVDSGLRRDVDQADDLVGVTGPRTARRAGRRRTGGLRSCAARLARSDRHRGCLAAHRRMAVGPGRRYRHGVDRRFLRPGWIAGHVLVFLAFLTCLRLGWWQWERTQEADRHRAEFRLRAAVAGVRGGVHLHVGAVPALEVLKDAEDDEETDRDLQALLEGRSDRRGRCPTCRTDADPGDRRAARRPTDGRRRVEPTATAEDDADRTIRAGAAGRTCSGRARP